VTATGRSLRDDALAIWQAGIAAANPDELIRAALTDPALQSALRGAPRILVVGAGKAGAAMSAAVESVVNVPAETARPLQRIRLHPARPAGTNHPTSEGVEGTRQILSLLQDAGPEDVALCLLSGGGSALLPAPAEGVTLEDKQAVTRLLHSCGATINEMNAVRKHLSASKGGRLAQAFRGRAIYSLVISDVIGDPLDVIASGPTAADPSTFVDALDILNRFRLMEAVPPAILRHLQLGQVGRVPETLKVLPPHVHNRIIGNNSRSLDAAQRAAEGLGYRTLNLGSFIEGETRQVAVAVAGIVRSIRAESKPLVPPACILLGGETTVTLTDQHGLGGRNQEFVLAAANKLAPAGLHDVLVLSGGTDGEDGPTDAAGAWADEFTLAGAAKLGLNPATFLARNDAYHFFKAVDGLIRTGLTQTNVMDIRVILIH
jgi:glycerate 2-kinase